MTGKFMIPAMLALISVTACTGEEETTATVTPEVAVTDTIGEIISSVRATNRLYTSEYQIHKLISYDDVRRLKGSLWGRKFNVRLPQGDRKVLIPVDAVIKGYIDFNGFSRDNVKVDSTGITVILPDPVVEMTSSKIDHHNIKEYTSVTRPSFTAAELSLLEKQGRAAIIASIPQMGIVDDARRSAFDILVPMLTSMGYSPERIKVEFRSDFSARDYEDRIIRIDSQLK